MIMHNMITKDKEGDPVENSNCWAAPTSTSLENLSVSISLSFDRINCTTIAHDLVSNCL